MKRSRVYITLTTKDATIILETPTPLAGEKAYRFIKEHVPTVNLGIYGARDIQTLRRTHRELKTTHVVRDTQKFIDTASSFQKKTVLV